MSDGSQHGRGRTVLSGAELAALFPDNDDSSDGEKDQAYFFRQDPPKAASGAAAVNLVSAAAALGGLFPSPPRDKDEALDRRAVASGLSGSAELANGLPQDSTATEHVENDRKDGSRNKFSSRWWGNKGDKKRAAKTRAGAQASVDQSPLHADMRLALSGNEGGDIEVARKTRSPSQSSSFAESEFELNQNRSPVEWMRVGDTTGTFFLWYTVVLQAAIICASMAFIASAKQDQFSWETGCWGRWISLSDAEGVEFVEFETRLGWQLYGKGDKFGHLGEVSRLAAVVGGLAGGVHTLLVIFSCAFFLFSASTLCLNHGACCCCFSSCCWRGGSGGGGNRAKNSAQRKDRAVRRLRESRLVLGRDCHRWMFVMAVVDVLAGFWCFGVGCAGFYFAVAGDFTDALQEIVSGWGESVSCAVAQTTPRFGFYANGVSVFLLVGGGIASFFKTYTSDRELGEAAEMWEKDRAEIFEMEARTAMIKKKEDYAAAAAAAAQAVVGATRAYGSEATGAPRPSSWPSPSFSPPASAPPPPLPPLGYEDIESTAALAAIAASAARREEGHVTSPPRVTGRRSHQPKLASVDLSPESLQRFSPGVIEDYAEPPSLRPPPTPLREGGDASATPSGEK